jgi:hypothetical protein
VSAADDAEVVRAPVASPQLFVCGNLELRRRAQIRSDDLPSMRQVPSRACSSIYLLPVSRGAETWISELYHRDERCARSPLVGTDDAIQFYVDLVH